MVHLPSEDGVRVLRIVRSPRRFGAQKEGLGTRRHMLARTWGRRTAKRLHIRALKALVKRPMLSAEAWSRLHSKLIDKTAVLAVPIAAETTVRQISRRCQHHADIFRRSR